MASLKKILKSLHEKNKHVRSDSGVCECGTQLGRYRFSVSLWIPSARFTEEDTERFTWEKQIRNKHTKISVVKVCWCL